MEKEQIVSVCIRKHSQPLLDLMSVYILKFIFSGNCYVENDQISYILPTPKMEKKIE